MSIEITLIEEIEKYPCLYNFYLHEYNKKEILDEAWTVIASNCNLSVPECKDKWKNIRSSFVRSLKHNGGKAKKPYYLSHYLQFITPFLKTGVEFNTDDSQNAEIDSNDNITDTESITAIKVEPDIDLEAIPNDFEQEVLDIANHRVISSHPRAAFMKKRRKIASNNHTRNIKIRKIPVETTVTRVRTENNAMKYFLMSLLPEFDTMNEDQIRMFKIKVMMLLDDIKTQCSGTKEDLKFNNDELQKRLINLLLKNLEQKTL